MSNNKIIILLFYSFLFRISCRFFSCPETSEPPQVLNNTNFSFQQVDFYQVPLNPVSISNKVLVNTHQNYKESIKEYLKDSDYCPENYIIPKKEELEEIINELGDNAYSIFTDKNGLDMVDDIYYVTNTKGSGEYNKYFMILKSNKIQFEDFDPFSYIYDPTSNQKFHTICFLKIPEAKIVFPDNKRDFDYNTELNLEINFNGYYTDMLWKINDKIFNNKNITITLNEEGVNNVEFWGKYITGKTEYLCELFYVSNEKISNEQEYDDSKIKKIETNFKMHYNPSLHFTTSNCPVAPRDDGGYYIAVSNTEKILHILSYDKDDNLIKDFDTKEKARPHDITQTYIGFVVYVMDADNRDHSYIILYNKNFEIINRVQIMNNTNIQENKRIDSTPEKQIIRYSNDGSPQFGIRLIYQADNAKLVYSRGRIFLIFAHYNIFVSKYEGHNADTVVTFNDNLEDIDFGLIFGASHSLIQSATYDEDYFWTASLSDAYPQGIRVEYTSKRNFQNNFYDPVFKKHNLRVYYQNDNLAGNIKGYMIGWADGKLGGILYFEKLELYSLIYAKTPNYSEDEKNNKTIIYITTWKFINETIEQIKTKEIKIFQTDNIMQLRAGKLGNDKVFITYLETKSLGHNYYGDIPAGSIPKIFVVKLPDFEYIKNDEKIDKLLMNTNEDLRTFRNGVLIWAATDSNKNLVINKIGDDINYINNPIEIIPSITWKDIYNLNITGTKKINNEDISGPILYIRGITSSNIDINHTFVIYLIFNKKLDLRYLEEEENEIRISAICTALKAVKETYDGINMIDYECIGNKNPSHNFNNYNLINIEEGNNDNSLKKSNLNNLVSEIKNKYGGLDKLETIKESKFNEEDLNKIVIFKMDEKIQKISAINYKFNFKIDGELNKDITSQEIIINEKFELVEIDTKADCIFKVGLNKIASLSCDLNVENYKNIEKLSFKTSEIKTGNNEIYLAKFNDIELINSQKEDEDKDNDNKTTIIVVSVVCAVVAAAVIGILIYFFIRKQKSKIDKAVNDINEIKVEDTIQKNEVVNDEGNGNKVINYKN